MSDTPRTDAALEGRHEPSSGLLWASFARELERENASLREDKARLDWLDANMGKVVPGSAEARYWMLGQKEFAPNRATNLRAAIDAARKP